MGWYIEGTDFADLIEGSGRSDYIEAGKGDDRFTQAADDARLGRGDDFFDGVSAMSRRSKQFNNDHHHGPRRI